MLTLPMLAGMMVQTLYLFVDMIFVGMVSADALTALSFNLPIVFFGLGLMFGLGSGVTAVIAQFIGGNDKKNADNCAEHAVILGIILGTLITAAGLKWGRPLLILLGVSDDILYLAWGYLKVLLWGYIFIVLSVFFRSVLSGEGDVKTPMIIQGSGTVLNMILDPIFIFYLDMGVEGAALATVISQVIVTLIFIYFLFVKEHAYITFAMKDFKFSNSIIQRIFKLGLPASFSLILMSFGSGIFNRILVTFSNDAVAAYQVGSRIDHLFIMPAISISTSLVTLVGMFYGAKRMDLVKNIIYYGMSRAAFIGFGIGVIFFIFPPQLVTMFSRDSEIIEMGAGYLRAIARSYPFIAVSMTCGRSLQGLGNAVPMLVITFLRVFLFSLVLASIFVFWMGKPVEWVWYAILTSMIATAGIAFWWLRSTLKKVI